MNVMLEEIYQLSKFEHTFSLMRASRLFITSNNFLFQKKIFQR